MTKPIKMSSDKRAETLRITLFNNPYRSWHMECGDWKELIRGTGLRGGGISGTMLVLAITMMLS